MKLIKQIILGITSVIVFGLIMNFFLKNYVIKDYKINPNKEILVFGDSHAEFNFYDVKNKIQNFGVSAEAPNLTYLKAKLLIKENNSYAVILTLSPHNISTWRAKRLYEQDSSGAIFSQYWNILDNQHLLKYYNSLPMKTRLLFHLKKTVGAPNMGPSFLTKKEFKGGFYKGKDTTIVSLSEAKKTYNKHFGESNSNENNIVLNSDRFKDNYKELISFILSKGSQVYIISTPLHDNYLNLISERDYKSYKNFLEELKYDFPKIHVLDYAEIDIPDIYFLNSDHLNLKGAKYFTEIVTKAIPKS